MLVGGGMVLEVFFRILNQTSGSMHIGGRLVQQVRKTIRRVV